MKMLCFVFVLMAGCCAAIVSYAGDREVDYMKRAGGMYGRAVACKVIMQGASPPSLESALKNCEKEIEEFLDACCSANSEQRGMYRQIFHISSRSEALSQHDHKTGKDCSEVFDDLFENYLPSSF